MSNIQKLLNSKNKSQKLFATAIIDFKNSQGYYSRLYRDINDMKKEDFSIFRKSLLNQKFNDVLDVVYWLEC